MNKRASELALNKIIALILIILVLIIAILIYTGVMGKILPSFDELTKNTVDLSKLVK